MVRSIEKPMWLDKGLETKLEYQGLVDNGEP